MSNNNGNESEGRQDGNSNIDKINELLRILRPSSNPNSQNNNPGRRPTTRPFTGGFRRPTSLRSLIDRQNLDATDVYSSPRIKRITNMRDGVREASLYRTASTLSETDLFDGEGRSLRVIALKDPYDHLAKLRFENCYRTDPTVRRCVDVLAKFAMGKRTHFHITTGSDISEESMVVEHGFKQAPPTNNPLPSSKSAMPGTAPKSTNASPVKTAADFQNLAPSQQPAVGDEDDDDDEDLNEAESEIERMFAEHDGSADSPLSEQELRELHRMINEINYHVKFHERIKAALTQAYVYGRSALKMEIDQHGIPTELKLLNPKKLETVYIDPSTWKLVAVDYADRKENEPLLAEEIIYFANQDYHISPDTLYYGYSRVEPIVHVSETNQLLDEIDLKEGARSMWAGSGVIKFPPDTADDLVDEFVTNFYPGTWNATSQSVQIDTYNLKLDYVALTNAREENDRRIIRGLGVPQFLVGFENISNRATSEEVMISWHESELDAERTWLQDVLEPQWFSYLVNLRFPDLMAAGQFTPIRVKLDFQNISFETMREKSEAIVPLFDRGLMPPEKVMEIMRTPDQLSAVLAELARREEEKERAFQLEYDLQQQRAKSYLLNKTQEGVEQRRRDEKTTSEAAAANLTANAALKNLAMLNEQQENNSAQNELYRLQMQLLKEAHQQDADLRIKKARLIEQLTKRIDEMQAEGN